MTRPDAGLSGAWSHRRWRWLLCGTAISATAHEVSLVALVVVIIDRTGSVGWVGVATTIRVALFVVLGPVAGALASAPRRRRLLVGLEVGRGVLAGLSVVAVLADAPAGVIVVVAVLTAVTMLASRAAILAATPTVVDVDDLAAAVAATCVANDAALFIGPALAALAVGMGGPGQPFFLAGVLSLLAAVAVSRCGDVDTAQPTPAPAVSTPPEQLEPGTSRRREGPRPVSAGIAASWRGIRASRGLMALLGFSAAMMVLAGAESVVHVLVAKDVVDRGAGWVGVMGATAGGAGVMAAPFATRVCTTAGATRWLVAAASLCGASFAALALTDSALGVLLAMATNGASWMVIGVVFITLLQRWTREGLLAQVLGIHESVGAASEMGGALAATALVATFGLSVTLSSLGVLVVLACLAIAPIMNGEMRHSEAIRIALMPMVERFRRLAVFEGASNATLERLARAAVEMSVRAGDRVIDEGAAADTIYIVVDGSFVATSVARGELSRMGPDDWFGEIGVIGRQPRTATVHALGDGTILAIDADVFLAAVRGSVAPSGVFSTTMARRLARSEGLGAR